MLIKSFRSVVLRVSEGDPVAFEAIFQAFSPQIYAFALKLTRSPSVAEELVQDVFLKVWVAREDLTKVDHFPSWLYAICRNHAFNALKRIAIEEKAKAQLVGVLEESTTETESGVIYRDYERLVEKAIERLSPQQKMVYSLCRGEGLRYEEAAEKLQISRLTVKTHMQQALRNIKSHVKSIVAIQGILAFFITQHQG